MPNHISNHLFVRGEDEDNDYDAMKLIRAVMDTGESRFDFNVLDPYPAEWEALDKAWHEAFERSPRQPMSELPADGYNNGGYNWCIKHWGTKWNAYDISYQYDDLYFDTAWSTPLPIWAALSARFPEMELVIEFADEDIGSNCGILTYKGGKQISITREHSLDDPVMFARAIRAEASAADNWRQLQELKELNEAR